MEPHPSNNFVEEKTAANSIYAKKIKDLSMYSFNFDELRSKESYFTRSIGSHTQKMNMLFLVHAIIRAMAWGIVF